MARTASNVRPSNGRQTLVRRCARDAAALETGTGQLLSEPTALAGIEQRRRITPFEGRITRAGLR